MVFLNSISKYLLAQSFEKNDGELDLGHVIFGLELVLEVKVGQLNKGFDTV